MIWVEYAKARAKKLAAAKEKDSLDTPMHYLDADGKLVWYDHDGAAHPAEAMPIASIAAVADKFYSIGGVEGIPANPPLMAFDPGKKDLTGFSMWDGQGFVTVPEPVKPEKVFISDADMGLGTVSYNPAPFDWAKLDKVVIDAINKGFKNQAKAKADLLAPKMMVDGSVAKPVSLEDALVALKQNGAELTGIGHLSALTAVHGPAVILTIQLPLDNLQGKLVAMKVFKGSDC